MADIGVWMAASTLEHKLETSSKTAEGEATWNVRRMPKRLVQEPPPHRMFVAAAGCWRGYFHLIPEVLFNPDDEQAPYTLIFDTKSWTEIPVVAVSRFRGFRYGVPGRDDRGQAAGNGDFPASEVRLTAKKRAPAKE